MKYYLLTILIISQLCSYAQEIERSSIATSGTFSNNGIQLGYTIGQVSDSYTLSTDIHLTEGFQQGEYSITLPVELLSFDANRLNDKKAKLIWETATEQNNKGFYIERKNEDETEFRAIEFVEGNTNSASNISYTFLDNNEETEPTYYRLKQVDTDETFTYSEIKTVPPISIKTTANLSPNPVGNELNIQLTTSSSSSELKINIYNLQGKLIKENTQKIASSSEIIRLSLDDDLSQGTYILHLVLGEEILDPLTFVKL